MSRSFAPSTILLTVTPLLAGYGSAKWSWVGGPIASLAVWALEHAQRDAQPAAAEVRTAAVHEPATADR